MAKKQYKETDIQDLINEWHLSKSWVDGYTVDFHDLDTLADGVALNRVKGAPVVGDVTLASDIRQIPRNSVQQLPTFSAEVNGTKRSRVAIICSFLLRRVVFNQDTFGKGILSTIQLGAEAALTRGFQVFMASIGTAGTDFGATLKQVHYKDFGIERGVFDFSDSTFFYVRSRVTKGRLKKLIASAESNPDTTWNVKCLKELLENGPGASDEYYSDESAPRMGQGVTATDNQFDIITRYEVGPYYRITTFSPNIPTALRDIKSKSKFGYPRVQAIVLDPAQLSPFGVSRARLASPAANYANIYLQSTAKMQLINADPPILQRGQFSTPVKLKRGVTWKAMDPNADANLKELSNSTMREFRNVLDFVGNQIHTIMGVGGGASTRSSSAYVNSDVAQAQNMVRDLSAAQVTAILENFLRQYALTALDLFVSEQTGVSPLIVDDEAKDAINALAREKFVPTPDMPTFVPPIGDDNTIEIDWEKFYEGISTWTVTVDLSMTKDNLEAKKRADLQDAVTVASQTSNPEDPNAQARVQALQDRLFKEMVPDMEIPEQSTPSPDMNPGQGQMG